jgi:undecaprenyl-diphosphatase
MRTLSDVRWVAPLLALAWVWLVWRGGPKGRRVALGAILLVVVTDQLTAHALKPLIARPRPHSSSFGFPSSHAANVFGQAVFLMRFYPRLAWPLLLAASAVGLSRIYLGKHYPLDVAAGAVVGALCGWLAYRAVERHAASIERLWVWLRSRVVRISRDGAP